jgi:tetratricopeptide (TPR) repeat protein
MRRAISNFLPIWLAVCLACLASARVAHAEDPAMRAAKRHYERGQKLFGLQKFDEALEQFQKAFDAKPIPDFLFNIGQCHRNLGDYDPETPNREKVEELITQLEEKQAAEESRKRRLRREKRDEEPDEPTASGSPIYTKWWFWTGVVVVGAGAGVGIYAATSAGGPPDTSLGRNIVFGK